MPPIHWAAARGDLAELVTVLGGEPRLVDETDSTGKTPLTWAVCSGHVDILKKLLEARADVHVADSDRWAPLHFACGGASLEVVLMLLGAGADPSSRDRWGQTGLMLAAESAPEEVVACLVRHVSSGGRGIDAMDHERRTALHRCVCVCVCVCVWLWATATPPCEPCTGSAGTAPEFRRGLSPPLPIHTLALLTAPLWPRLRQGVHRGPRGRHTEAPGSGGGPHTPREGREQRASGSGAA
jgi:hypothetical protein